jgi:hypothetical protein
MTGARRAGRHPVTPRRQTRPTQPGVPQQPERHPALATRIALHPGHMHLQRDSIDLAADIYCPAQAADRAPEADREAEP